MSQVSSEKQLDEGVWQAENALAIQKNLALALARRTFLRLMLLQDFSDAIIAINDVSGMIPVGQRSVCAAPCLLSATR